MDPFMAFNPFGGMLGGLSTPLSTFASSFMMVASLAAAYVLYNEMNQDDKKTLTKKDIADTWLTAFSRKTPDEARSLIATQFPDWPPKIETVPLTAQGVAYIRSKIDDGTPIVFMILGTDGKLVEWNPTHGLFNAPVQVYV